MTDKLLSTYALVVYTFVGMFVGAVCAIAAHVIGDEV